ncbi:MAG TPA: condensation domain-containing protein, partial [Candidatus Dormibacteraeota bacterium]|nr:condensation domain-containing protein [Candidatus Dormibacteraeota bacterium]
MIAHHRIGVQSIVELLQWRAATHPEKTAYSFLLDEGDRKVSCTYGELDRRARAIAAELQANGGEGERVLILYPPGLSYIAAFFGCHYAGAVAVPAYPPHQTRNILRLQKIVADARPALALAPLQTQQALHAVCNDAGGIPNLRVIHVDLIEAAECEHWKQPVFSESAAAFLQYTSGSTGTPRGVVLTHGNLLHNSALIESVFGYDEDAHCVSWLPAYHDMGLIGGILQPLFGGYSCTLMPPLYFLQEPVRWLREISRHENVISGGPDFAYRFCAEKISPEQRELLDLRTWRVAFSGAEPVRYDTLRHFTEIFGQCGFRPKAFLPCYGLAEATLLVSGTRNQKFPVTRTVQGEQLEKHSWVECSSNAGNVRHLASSGGIPGQRVEIVDPHSLTLCGPDQVGEIWVQGPSVAAGYWRRQEETARTFGAYLRDTGEGPFLRTGDLGIIRDKELFVTGRLKDLIIIHGRNLYPQDIESTVQSAHPALRSTIGAAFSIEKDGEERLVVVQEIDRHIRKGLDEILEQVRLKIHEAHEVSPCAVVLIRKGGVPRTSSGKIQRHACRIAFEENSFSVIQEWRQEVGTASGPANAETVPLGAEWLAHILAKILHIDERRIDAERHITDYGLDSIQAIEFLHQIEMGTGKSLSMSQLLQGPSLGEIVSLLSRQSPETSLENVQQYRPALGETEHPASRGQQELWLAHRLAPLSSAYNLAGGLRVAGKLDVFALERAFQKLVDRHPSLRTTFFMAGAELRQRIKATERVYFQFTDLFTWTEERLRQELLTESHKPFNLESGPLFRVYAFRRQANEHVLLVVLHHMIGDLWSVALLLRELDLCYRAECAGRSAELPALTSAYVDYAAWQSQLLSGPDGEKLWRYWQQQLEKPWDALELGNGHHGLQKEFGAGFEQFFLGTELTNSLLEFAQSRRVTPYTVLLAIFQLLLMRYSGQRQFLVGTPASGRSKARFKNVCGYFVNPLVVRADLSGSLTFEQHLARVHEIVLDAFEHQDFPFQVLVER